MHHQFHGQTFWPLFSPAVVDGLEQDASLSAELVSCYRIRLSTFYFWFPMISASYLTDSKQKKKRNAKKKKNVKIKLSFQNEKIYFRE